MKRVLALILAAVLLIGSLPSVAVRAAEAEELVSAEPLQLTEKTAPEETAPTAKPVTEQTLFLEKESTAPDPGLPDNDALFEAYAQQCLYGNKIATFGVAAGARLSGDEKVLYDALIPVIKQIASGERTSTVVGIGKTVTLSNGSTYTADVEAAFSGAKLEEGMADRVISALLTDFPYEMYWYDKVTGANVTSIRGSTLLYVQMSFAVAENYSTGDLYTANETKTGAAGKAAANALTIVGQYSEQSDYEKLCGYKTRICDLVSYDYTAANAGDFSQNNDPWQLIHVFDGDSTTNVVCEGYAKAFMYLCDLTSFHGDVDCYTVTGTMNGMGHMWNIVTMGGKNYLVDLTNSDTGTVGQNGQLFLAGCPGNAEEGYVIQGVSFLYDADVKSFWGTDADSILTLHESNYIYCEHVFGDWETQTEATCVAKGVEIRTCSQCSHQQSRETDYADHRYVETVTAPTYTKQGYTTYTCSVCGDSYQDTFVEALGLPVPVVVASNDAQTGDPLLSWTDDGEADAYLIYRATSKDGEYTHYAAATERDAYTDTKASAGKTYYYKVKAVCAEDSKLSSGHSEIVTAVSKCAQPVITVTANSSGKPVVQWTKVSGGSQYYVYRADSEHGSYNLVKSTASTSYTDSSAKAGTTYYYKVKTIASKNIYDSAYSEIQSCVVACASPMVSISVEAASGKPVVKWTQVSGAKRYVILRRLPGEKEFTKLAEQTGLSYKDSAAPVDRDVEYVVRAIGSAEKYNSADSAVKKVHTTLAKPVLTVTINAASGKPRISWKAVKGAVHYKVYRYSESGSGYKEEVTVISTSGLEWEDTSAKAGSSYYYKVIAVGMNSKSAYSSYMKAATQCAQPVITVTANSSGKPVVKWTKVSGSFQYCVYRATSKNGSYSMVKSTTSTNYTDNSARAGTTYYYKVKAIASKSTYNSVYSAPVSVNYGRK